MVTGQFTVAGSALDDFENQVDNDIIEEGDGAELCQEASTPGVQPWLNGDTRETLADLSSAFTSATFSGLFDSLVSTIGQIDNIGRLLATLMDRIGHHPPPVIQHRSRAWIEQKALGLR